MTDGAGAPSIVLGADWLRDFHPFTLQHLVASVFFGGLMTLAIREGLRRRALNDRGASEHAFGRYWGIGILIYQAMETAWWLLPGNFVVEKSLPLAMCDLAAWTAGITLITRNRSARVLLYYWGLCLSSQAFLTPILHEGQGMGTVRFWFFYIGHTNIVGAALYDLIVRRFRPRLADWWFTVLVSMAYVALIVPLNIGLNVNYGFMGPTDDQAGVVKLMPGWPWRVHAVIAGGFVLYIIATVPWILLNRAHLARTRAARTV